MYEPRYFVLYFPYIPYPLYTPTIVNLLYFTEANLRDRFFIQDFVHNFKFKEKTIVLHAPFGDTLRETRFVAKRISSLLSESMVYNNFLMGDQRDCFFIDEQGLMQVNTKPMQDLLHTSNLLIIGPVVKRNGKAEIGDAIHMLQAARAAFEIDEIMLFPTRSKSPLAAKKVSIDQREEVDRLLGIYEEESEILELAYRLRPVRLASPVNYSLATT